MSSGIVCITASAAPVVDGTIFAAAARPLLGSLASGPSTNFCFAVYPWTVVIVAFLTPKFSKIICITGATELVVQDAFAVIELFVANLSSLTPTSAVTTSPVAGAVITTLFAPTSRCALAFSAVVKNPEDSTTTPIPSSFHGNFAGSFSANTLMSFAKKDPAKLPWKELG